LENFGQSESVSTIKHLPLKTVMILCGYGLVRMMSMINYSIELSESGLSGLYSRSQTEFGNAFHNMSEKVKILVLEDELIQPMTDIWEVYI
jgi:hypothetical protein